MTLQDLIQPDNVLCNAQARSKKHCLEILSELLSRSHPEIPHEEIFARLVERERLGCTCLGSGTAFPHCRIDDATAASAALVRLSSPVDFDSIDGELVDIVFGLVVPSEPDESHRAAIAEISRLIVDEELQEQLRQANSSSELYRALIGGDAVRGARSGSEGA